MTNTRNKKSSIDTGQKTNRYEKSDVENPQTNVQKVKSVQKQQKTMKKTTTTTLQGSRSETTTHKEPGLNEKETFNGSIQDIDDHSKVQPQILSENRLNTGKSSTDDDVPDGQ